MAKSKRNRVVSLTKSKKKSNNKESKSKFIDEVRECCDEYKGMLVIRIGNMRNVHLKQLRTHLKQLWNSRLFIGHNKLIRIAFGTNEQDEYKTNLHHIASCLRGQCGLLFTNADKEQVLEFLSKFHEQGYARTGDLASSTVTLEAGPLDQLAHSLEPTLRQLGMPTVLKKAIIHLSTKFVVCKKGQQLTSEQARILKLLNIEMAEFGVQVDAIWNSKDGTYEKFVHEDNQQEQDDDDEENMQDDDDDDD